MMLSFQKEGIGEWYDSCNFGCRNTIIWSGWTYNKQEKSENHIKYPRIQLSLKYLYIPVIATFLRKMLR